MEFRYQHHPESMLTKLTTFSLICLIIACNTPAKQPHLSNPEHLSGDWSLVSAFPDTINLKKAVMDKWPYISINSAKKSIGGYSGCNTFGGEFTVTNDKITLGDLMATQRGCLGSIEPALFKHLRSANRYEVNKTRLKLYAMDTLLLSFARKAAQPK